MPDQTVQTNNQPTAPELKPENLKEPATRHQGVLDTIPDSNFFPRTEKDVPSCFWPVNAWQHGDEFLDIHNGELDVLLIFAGLCSTVSSAFIVNLQTSLSPSASDTTNALPKTPVNKIDNTTFSSQEAALPVWTGPSSTKIWIQTLAYTSLSSSLFAAFGAVQENSDSGIIRHHASDEVPCMSVANGGSRSWSDLKLGISTQS